MSRPPHRADSRLTAECLHSAPYRVESIASTTSLDVDFSGLRNAIQSLQKTSLRLDIEKDTAEKKLRKLLHKFARRHFIRRQIHRALCKLRKLFGKECPSHDASSLAAPVSVGYGAADKPFECSRGRKHANQGMLPVTPRIGHAGAKVHEQRQRAGETEAFDKRRFPSKKFKKAVKRVRDVNQKLKAFERGFIHEDGIKDREWYRNLDVAPGKWLGGCTVPSHLCNT